MRRFASFLALFATLLCVLLVAPAAPQNVTTQCIANVAAQGTSDAITSAQLPCGTTTTMVLLTVASANATTAPTYAPIGSPPLPIQNASGGALAIGALQPGAVALLTSNGSAWLLLNSQQSPGNSAWPATVNATSFGAKCVGVTNDDTSAIQTAISSLGNAGGQVIIPATGSGCYVPGGLTLGNGVVLKGLPSQGVLTTDTATVAYVVQSGSWLICGFAAHCIASSAQGVGVEDLNLIWDQAIPQANVAYTPTSQDSCDGGGFPCWGIKFTGTTWHVKNVRAERGKYCLSFVPPAGNGGGTYSYLENIHLGCLNIGLQLEHINDTMDIKNIHDRPLWYMNATGGTTPEQEMVNYLLANRVCNDVHYLDNPNWNGAECFQAKVGWQFTNGTTLTNTHSLYNLHGGTGWSCNLVAVCAQTTTNGTIVTGVVNDWLAQSDTGNSQNATLFSFGDGTSLRIGTLDVNAAGGAVMSVGAGSPVTVGGLSQYGNVSVGLLNVLGYSQVASGNVAFAAATGASIAWDKAVNFVKPTSNSPGSRLGGAGLFGAPKHVWNPWGSAAAWTSQTGTGSAVTVSTNDLYAPMQQGVRVLRIAGRLHISAGASAAHTCSIAVPNFSSLSASIPTDNTGYQNFDSNYIDVADAATQNTIGAVQLTCFTGVVIDAAELTLQAY